MKTKELATLAIATVALLSSQLFGLDNEGIIKLKNAGFDDETILLKMDQEEAEYDLSTDGLIALKEAGVSDAIVKKALQLNSGTSPATTNSGEGEFSNADLPSIGVPKIKPVIGGTYYTRVTFFYEKGKHISTNYARGLVVPINTKVELTSFKKKSFELRIVDTGETILMVNVPNYTGHTAQTLPENYLADVMTPIEKLPDSLKESVLAGQLRLGMTKEIAIAARGYPPIHATPSTEGDRWVYWSSRFVQLTVVFRDNKLVEGRGLH